MKPIEARAARNRETVCPWQNATKPALGALKELRRDRKLPFSAGSYPFDVLASCDLVLEVTTSVRVPSARSNRACAIGRWGR
jgi:hypothetical protein